MVMRQPSLRNRQRGSELLDGETDLYRDLPMINLVFINAPAGFDYLEPAQVLDGFPCAFQRGVDGVLNACSGGAGNFDDFIDLVFHML